MGFDNGNISVRLRGCNKDVTSGILGMMFWSVVILEEGEAEMAGSGRRRIPIRLDVVWDGIVEVSVGRNDVLLDSNGLLV